MSGVDWVTEQRQDSTLARVIELWENCFHPRGEKCSTETAKVQKFLREWSKLEVINGILYRNATLDGERVVQLVLPDHFKDIALMGIHDDTGHQGKDKSVWLARQRFYWPGLEKDKLVE